MRKFISIVVALIVGVSAGLGSSAIWVRARVLPYCTVANNADAYHLEFVRVKAKVQFDHGEIFIYEDCDPIEALASWVKVENADWPIPGPIHEKRWLLSDSTTKTADAIVEGEFNAEHSLGCYGPKFRILASKVKLISPVQDYVPPVSDGEGPALRLKH